jgi:hypothetical protein
MAVTALITSVGAQLCVSVSLLLSLHPASVCPDAWPAVRAVHDWRYFFGVGGVGLRFEFRTWHLQSRSSMARATPPVHFALVILGMGVLQTIYP